MKRKVIALACAALLLTGCGSANAAPVPTVDPHEGMVEVSDGAGSTWWVEEYDDVPVSTIEPETFIRDGQFFTYKDSEVLRGIDVSEHQFDIDWEQVATADIDFVIIRAGYRGYSVGGLFEDEYFRSNIEGAIANGIDVGIYFFSQATTIEEAQEEANYLLGLIDGYDITWPVFYDWERMGFEDARTNDVNGETLTTMALAFCDVIDAAGYQPGIYAYRHLGYYEYNLSSIKDYPLWVGAVGDKPDFYYAYDIWQFAIDGEIPGIETGVDLNIVVLGDESPDGKKVPLI